MAHGGLRSSWYMDGSSGQSVHGFGESVMEEPRYNDEEPEESKLKEQADNNDLFSSMEQCQRARCLNTATSGLNEEADHVASHKHLRKPLLRDQRVLFAIDQENYAAQDDVDRRSEKGWGDQQQKRLHDERAQSPQVVCAEEPTNVSDDFD